MILKVTKKEKPELFIEIGEHVIESTQEHRKGSSFYENVIIEFTHDQKQYYPNIEDYENYIGYWEANIISDPYHGYNDLIETLERVEPVKVEIIKYKKVKS